MRSPKSEVRSPKGDRNPKSEVTGRHFALRISTAVPGSLLLGGGPAFAKDPGGASNGVGANVTLSVSGTTATLGNGVITAAVDTTSSKVTSYLFYGTQMHDTSGLIPAPLPQDKQMLKSFPIPRFPGQMLRKWSCGLAILVVSFTPVFALEGMLGIHDPSTVVKCDGTFYVFGTGRGIPFLTSSNGFAWQRAGRVFDRIPNSVKSYVPQNDGVGVWAPDVLKLNGEYYLYSWRSVRCSGRPMAGPCPERT
jgi:hypothetical protein